MQSGTPFKINYPPISEGCTDTNMLFKSDMSKLTLYSYICPVVRSSSSALNTSEINQTSVYSVYSISDYNGFYLLL